MHTFFASPAIYLYIFGVVVVNILFSYVPMIQTSYGDFSPVAILVGFIFVIRDYAQRATGHWVLVAMAIACLASYLMADPFVALASVLAFASSEIADWLLYTVTKKPFGQRVLISSIISTPVDTVVFLGMINALTTGTVILMILSKMIAAVIIWSMYRNDRQVAPA